MRNVIAKSGSKGEASTKGVRTADAVALAPVAIVPSDFSQAVIARLNTASKVKKAVEDEVQLVDSVDAQVADEIVAAVEQAVTETQELVALEATPSMGLGQAEPIQLAQSSNSDSNQGLGDFLQGSRGGIIGGAVVGGALILGGGGGGGSSTSDDTIYLQSGGESAPGGSFTRYAIKVNNGAWTAERVAQWEAEGKDLPGGIVEKIDEWTLFDEGNLDIATYVSGRSSVNVQIDGDSIDFRWQEFQNSSQLNDFHFTLTSIDFEKGDGISVKNDIVVLWRREELLENDNENYFFIIAQSGEETGITNLTVENSSFRLSYDNSGITFEEIIPA
jgi:hypothetical protein